MPKKISPSLFHIVSAIDIGFHEMELLWVESHYVRIVIDRGHSVISVEVLPAELLGWARPFVSSSGKSGWDISRWWDDSLFQNRVRSTILEQSFDLAKPYSFLIHKNSIVTVGKER